MAELTERDLADLERGARSADDDHGGCAKDVLALVAEVRRQRAALERIPEEVSSSAVFAALDSLTQERDEARQRLERVEAAAREAEALCNRNRPTMAGAVLRVALAAAPAPGETEPKERKPTTRRTYNGTVHEMADFGVGTMCGRELPEPWTHTDAPVNCQQCLARLTRSRAELRAALKWVNPPAEEGLTQPWLNGRPFRCDCGCNVFRKAGVRYTCNACGVVHEGTSAEEERDAG